MGKGKRQSVKANVHAIAALRPTATRYEVTVRDHMGLIVCVWPSGARTFLLRYRQDGALKRVTLDATTLAEARRAWEDRRGEVRKGEDPAEQVKAHRAAKQLARQEARAAPTVETLADDYIRLHAKRHKRSWRADELMLASAVLPEWGKIKAAAIKRRDVIDLLDRIAERTPVRANRVLAVVRKMFNWALERGAIETTPVAGVKPPGGETSRDRVLTDDELRTFWLALPDSGMSESVRAALRLQLLTACRIGEVAGARWQEIDTDKAEWTIPGTRTKNGRVHLVPLSPAAIEALPANGRGFLFPAKSKTGHLRIDTVTHELGDAKLGIAERFTSHDLRRTAATKMAALGTPRVVLDALLNHKDRTVGAVYDRHDYLPEKRAALEAWARHLDAIVNHTPADNVLPLHKKSGKRR